MEGSGQLSNCGHFLFYFISHHNASHHATLCCVTSKIYISKSPLYLRVSSHHITSHHITLHHITSHHLVLRVVCCVCVVCIACVSCRVLCVATLCCVMSKMYMSNSPVYLRVSSSASWVAYGGGHCPSGVRMCMSSVPFFHGG